MCWISNFTPRKCIKLWLEIILESLDGQIDETRYSGSIFDLVIDAVKLDNISPQEFRILKDEESWEDTLIDERELGREEGLAEGHERGIVEGHEKGLAEGEQRGTEAIVRALISEGVSTEFIVRTTGLSEAEIETLRRT